MEYSIRYGGCDHVILIGPARVGMGYQNEFHTQDCGPHTNQTLFPMGEVTGDDLSHMWNA